MNYHFFVYRKKCDVFIQMTHFIFVMGKKNIKVIIFTEEGTAPHYYF